MRKTILIFSCCAFFALAAMARRTEALLEKNWKFTKGDVPEATQTNFDDSKWETVTIPHDWAIFGPFDRDKDLQGGPEGCLRGVSVGIVRLLMLLQTSRSLWFSMVQ